jgi:2-polyprenyl-3-methyl-5-hydroxy-6-metoxy-1,4-benzoquinol methylase
VTGDDRTRWNEKHARGHGSGRPLPWLCEHLPLLHRGTALDVACGAGHDAVHLAREGFDVLAVDVSDVALERARELARREGVRVAFERRDLAEEGLPPGRFDLVLVAHFLDRRLVPALREAVLPGGALVYETYTTAHAEKSGFRRAFCLEPGELLTLVEGWRVLAYREHGLRGSDVASVVAVRPGS